MSYIKCSGCHTPEACDTSIPHNSETPGMCWNAYSLQSRPAVVSVNDPALAQHPIAQANAASWEQATGRAARPAKAPPSAPRAPGQGSVTEQIFAACDACLALMYEQAGANPSYTYADALQEARKRAIPQLEAQGVNSNSARKGSSMWIAARR